MSHFTGERIKGVLNLSRIKNTILQTTAWISNIVNYAVPWLVMPSVCNMKLRYLDPKGFWNLQTWFRLSELGLGANLLLGVFIRSQQ